MLIRGMAPDALSSTAWLALSPSRRRPFLLKAGWHPRGADSDL